MAAIQGDIAVMSPAIPPIGAAPTRRFGSIVAVACAAALLAGCSSTGGSNRGVVNASQNELPMEMFLSQGYCPSVQIRGGTEAMVVYERGHEDDPAHIRYQGSITRTARECRTVGDTLSIKVGIAGRLTVGPKGGAGSATLPLRIAVVKQRGGHVFHSQAINVPVSVSGPPYSAEFTQVVENIAIQLGPQDRDLIVYVGFDEGTPRPTG
jgi:hypothetical protein